MRASQKKAKLKAKATTFIDPFVDFSFKRLFASDESKPILIGLLNHLFVGRKLIKSIEYGRNEYPGENAEEGGAVIDVICTDADGSKFILEVQRGYQKYFKERALFYASRVISEQAPKGGRKDWAYELTEVYLLAFLEDFNLPDCSRTEYVQDICLTNRYTGKIFYDKLGFIFIEMLNFVKKPDELETNLDKWLYALKHLTEFKKRPQYLSGPEFDQLFNLASYANLTKKEKEMYNTSLKYKWDNKNVLDYAIGEAETKGKAKGIAEGIAEGKAKGEYAKAIEIALKLKAKNTHLDEIAELTDLSIEEIEALV
ncbi:Rpn family recombination-promoting nuclease/putative transposase [Pedobacter hiemivivus]